MDVFDAYSFIHLFISSRCTEDASLTYTLRAAFSMQCVYLDATPQEGVNPVEYSRLWDHIPQEAITQKYCPWKLCIYVHVHVHVYMCMCTCMYVNYVCMCVYVCNTHTQHTHTHTHARTHTHTHTQIERKRYNYKVFYY